MPRKLLAAQGRISERHFDSYVRSLEKILAEREGRKPQPPKSTANGLGLFPPHNCCDILCGHSHPLRSCLCHPLYLSGLNRVFPVSHMGHAGYSTCLFHLNHCRDFLLTRTSGCPNLESFYESWISSFCDVDYCRPVVSSQCSHRPKRGNSRTNPITGRPFTHLRGMQKNSRPNGHLASTRNVSYRKLQYDVHPWHMP